MLKNPHHLIFIFICLKDSASLLFPAYFSRGHTLADFHPTVKGSFISSSNEVFPQFTESADLVEQTGLRILFGECLVTTASVV
jgi:hypothetical protein